MWSHTIKSPERKSTIPPAERAARVGSNPKKKDDTAITPEEDMAKEFDTDGFSKMSKVHASKKPLTVAKAPSFGRATSRAGKTTTSETDSPRINNQNKSTQPFKPTQTSRVGTPARVPRTATPTQSSSRASKAGNSSQNKSPITSPKHTVPGRRLTNTSAQNGVRSPAPENTAPELDTHKPDEPGHYPASDKDENEDDDVSNAKDALNHERLEGLEHIIAVKDGEIRDLQAKIQDSQTTKDVDIQDLRAEIKSIQTANEHKIEETTAAFLAQIASLESEADDARKEVSDLKATHRKTQEEQSKALNLKNEEIQKLSQIAHGQRGEHEAKESVLSLKDEFLGLQVKHKREMDEAAATASAKVEDIRTEHDELLQSRDQEIKEMSDLFQELQEKVEKAHQADKDQLKEAKKRHERELRDNVEHHEQELRDANRRYEGLQEKVSQLEQELREAVARHVQEMSDAKEERQKIVQDAIQRHEQESKDSASKYQQEVEDLMLKHHEEIKTARTRNEQAFEDSAAKHQQEIEALMAEHEVELEKATSKQEQAIADAAAKHQQEIEALMAKHKEDLEKATLRQEQAIADAAAKYQQESQSLEVKHLEELKTATMRDGPEAEALATKHQQDIQAMTAKHQEELSKIMETDKQELGNAAVESQQAMEDITTKHREELASAASQIEELRDVAQKQQQELGDVATSHEQEIERVIHKHQQELHGLTISHEQVVEEAKAKHKELEVESLEKDQKIREAAQRREKEIAQLQNQMQTAAHNVASLERTLSDLTDQKEDSSREAAANYEQDLRTATLKYEEELQSLRTIYATAVEEITALRRTLQDVELKHSEAVQEELQSLRTIYATAVEEITALRRKVEHVDQKRSEAVDEAASLKAYLDSLNLNWGEAVGQPTSLQATRKDGELERGEAAVEIALLRDKLELADRRFEQDQQAVSDLQSQIRRLQAQTAELSTDTDLDQNEAAVDAALLKDKLKLADLEIHLHKGTISALQNDVEGLQTQLAQSSTDTKLDRNEAIVDVALLKDKLELANIQIRQAKGTVSDLQEEIEGLKTQITDSTIVMDIDQNEAAVEIALLKNTLELANLESHQDKATITTLQKQIEGLQSQVIHTPKAGPYTSRQLRGELSVLGRHQAAQKTDLEALKADMTSESELREQEWKKRAEVWDRFASELQGMTQLVGTVDGSSRAGSID